MSVPVSGFLAAATETPTPKIPHGFDAGGFVEGLFVATVFYSVLVGVVAGILTYPILLKTGRGVLPPGKQPVVTGTPPKQLARAHFLYSILLSMLTVIALTVSAHVIPEEGEVFVVISKGDFPFAPIEWGGGLGLVFALFVGWYLVKKTPLTALLGVVTHLLISSISFYMILEYV